MLIIKEYRQHNITILENSWTVPYYVARFMLFHLSLYTTIFFHLILQETKYLSILCWIIMTPNILCIASQSQSLLEVIWYEEREWNGIKKWYLGGLEMKLDSFFNVFGRGDECNQILILLFVWVLKVNAIFVLYFNWTQQW